jgi:hypothetical protein
MRPDMEKPGAPEDAAGQVGGNSLPIGTAKNGPDAPETKSTSLGSAASSSLADIAARINEAHDQANGSYQRTIEAAMEAGRLLIQAKEQVGHGGWLQWLKVNTCVSERTAQYYMKVARDLPKSAIIADLTLNRALKLLGTPEVNPKRPAAPRSAASPKSAKVEVLPPEPKPPGSSSNLLRDDVLVDQIRSYIEVAERRGIDITNLVLGPPTLDPQTSVPPLRMPADSEPEISHHPSDVADGINTITDTEDADTADDPDELNVHYGPLTGREWIALSKCFDMHGPHHRQPDEPQYRPEFLRLVEFFNVPVADWTDRIMAGNAMGTCLPREDDTDHAEGVE